MSKKLGIITYHSAYNYGSVFQAYALQQYLVNQFPGCQIKMINYRLEKQKEYYKIVRFQFGKMALIKDILQLPILNKRITRSQKFENFINEKFLLTSEYTEPEEVYDIYSDFDIIISGSDQIWNKHSCELHTNEWKYIYPYVLHNFSGTKISYSSSLGGMRDEEMDKIIADIALFDEVAMREQSSAKYLSGKLDKQVLSVMDPTFLLDSKEWCRDFSLSDKDEGQYILFYSLNRDYASSLYTLKRVVEYAENMHLRVKTITPYEYLYDFRYNNVDNYCDAGPIEFLDLLKQARLVITDSYHGTALSINFNKNFFSVGINKKDARISELLAKLELTDRYIEHIDDLMSKYYEINDYTDVNRKLQSYIKQSKEYLLSNLKSAL